MVLVAGQAIAYQIPKAQLNKPLYIEHDGKIVYETEKDLSTPYTILNAAADNGDIALSIDGNNNMFTIKIKFSDGSIIMLSIDKRNILKKLYHYNSDTRKGEVYEGKRLDANIAAITFNVGIIFSSSTKLSKKRADILKNKQEEVARKKKEDYIATNILNFDAQIPLFAGLKWDDKLYDVLIKLQRVNSFKLDGITCSHLYDDELTNKHDIIINEYNKANNNSGIDLLNNLIEISKIVSDENIIYECRLSGSVTITGLPTTIRVYIGKTEEDVGHSIGTFNYLNRIILDVETDDNYEEIIDLYKKKYANYKLTVNGHNMEIQDDFDNPIEGSIYGMYYRISYNKNLTSKQKQEELQIKLTDDIIKDFKQRTKRLQNKSSESDAVSAI